MNKTSLMIKNRLSLRQPQTDSLEILEYLANELEMKKDIDLKVELEKVKQKFPTCTDFERDFPSLCFSLATGERVIIVTGCINALRSRVSGTLVNMIHALLRVIKYNYCKQCMRSKDVLALQY